MPIQKRPHVEPFVCCSACGGPLELDVAEASRGFFESRPAICGICNQAFDLWVAVVNMVRDNFMMSWAYGVIGARTTVHTFFIAPDQVYELKFSALDIPNDASILTINYTPEGGGCFPIELHGNSPRWEPAVGGVHLYGRAVGDAADRTKVNCFVTWFMPPDADDGWKFLLEAFRSYSRGRHVDALIPANIAVEAALSKAVFDGLRKASLGNKKEIEQFLSNRAGYADQLRFLAPLLADRHLRPRLPSEIEQRLHRLRRLRNEIAHDGVTKHPVEKAAVAELLSAATLGFHYARMLKEAISADA